jgi:hypothetical protein
VTSSKVISGRYCLYERQRQRQTDSVKSEVERESKSVTSVTAAEKYGGFSISEGTLSKNRGGSEFPNDSINSSLLLWQMWRDERSHRRDSLGLQVSELLNLWDRGADDLLKVLSETSMRAATTKDEERVPHECIAAFEELLSEIVDMPTSHEMSLSTSDHPLPLATAGFSPDAESIRCLLGAIASSNPFLSGVWIECQSGCALLVSSLETPPWQHCQ